MPATVAWYTGTVPDHEFVEWLFYAGVGLCALIAHTLLTTLRRSAGGSLQAPASRAGAAVRPWS